MATTYNSGQFSLADYDKINSSLKLGKEYGLAQRIAAIEVSQSGATVTQIMRLDDNEYLKFGTGTGTGDTVDYDVQMSFDGTQLEMLPRSDDLCAFNIGDGTTDMDFKWFAGATTKYALFDMGNAKISTEDIRMDMNTLSSTTGAGYPLSATNTRVLGVYGDDANASIGSGTMIKTIEGRICLNYTAGNREQEVASVLGKLKSVAGTNRHNMCAVMGSYEVGTSLTVDGQAWTTDPWIQAAIIGRIGAGTNITTINANGVLCGVAAMSNTVSFAANNGNYAGFYVGKWATTIDWQYGLLIDAGAISSNAIYVPGGVSLVAVKLGTLSSTTPGSGVVLDATNTRALEVNADDNNTARAVGTQNRAIMGRFMVYADNACEDWGVHGLSKMSAVAKTGNVSAGVCGAFETTGTCSTASGSGNTYCAGVMGRVGTGGSFTIGSGTKVACLLAFGNNQNSNAFTNTGYVGICVAQTDVGTAEVFDVGLDIEAGSCATGITLSATTQANSYTVTALPANARGSRFVYACATPAMGDGYGALEVDLTVSGTATGQTSAASCWINASNGSTLTSYNQCHTDGIWDGGATLTGANIAWARYQCLLASNPQWVSLFDLNFDGANSEIDAIFNCNNSALCLGYEAGSPSESAIGKIPFMSDAGGAVKYIYIYPS